ncbi:solute symporter family protein [Nonomuraea aridisoli]|uniref:Cation acetate symporter n=1 Tax=Nonomuraea aridisoli TaxID=2070368 RepID=A0A2W2DWC2_9ACTN|nr:cation acetate symporter [Nonomuraea aridisoli]PZG09385.1 cation acetate symporter [Nonomuraea aridisoli]
MILFLAFVAATLGITFWASRQTKTAADYYAGGRSFSGVQNGLAIGGDYMSAASFLGIAGIIALSGYDGFLYSIGFLVAWLVALLLVAELMRNSGKFTMADVLAFRMSPRPVRTAAGVSTIVVSIFYLLAQMVGAGALVGLLLGITGDAGKAWTIVGVGALMIVYVVFGGMKGTTWVQIVKAVLLMGGAALVTLLVLANFGFNLSALLGQAATVSGPEANPQSFLSPGLKYGTEAQGLAGKIDLISLGLALVLGTAGLPHILIRFYTVPTAKDARKSVLWGIGIIGVFYLLTLVLGFGAAALVGREAIAAGDAAGNTAAPMLAQQIGQEIFGDVGGTILLALIGAVAFATILAVVAGLTLASSSSFAHDLYAHVFKRGQASERQEVVVARVSAFVIGAVAIGLGILAQGQNVAFLVALAFAVAASGNLPAILYSLFWKRFNTAGAVSAIYGGLVSALLLVIFSPVVSGSETALFKTADFAWFPLSNPGIISIPLGFLCGWIGTVLSKEYNAAKYAEIEVRSLTGVGAEKASEH